MLMNILFIVLLTRQYAFSNDTEEFEVTEKYIDAIKKVSVTQEAGEQENVIINASETTSDDGNSAVDPTIASKDQTESCHDSTDASTIASVKDSTAHNDNPEEAGGVCTFAGPVHAKGSVLVCADYGYGPPAINPASSEIISSDLPDISPENPITSKEDSSSETPVVTFAGPVHAKGAVTVAANFGCGQPALTPAFSNFRSGQSLDATSSMEDITVDDNDATDAPVVTFAGPVHGKGTVSMATSFGYGAPASNPAHSNIGAALFPPGYFPYFFTQPSSALGNTQHSSATNSHLLSTFSPEKNAQLLEGAKSLLRNSMEPLHSNESLRNDEEFLAIDTILVNPEEEFKVPDTKLANSREDSEEMLPFFGFVPASGSVKIAARF